MLPDFSPSHLQSYEREADQHHASKNTKSTKLSKYWIISIVLWSALVFVLILWQTGVIFQGKKTTDSRQTNNLGSSETQGASNVWPNYAKGSIEETILKVPEYDPQNVTREEEYHVSREKSVIEKLNKEVLTEIIPEEITKEKVDSGVGLERFIEHILYINLDDDKAKRQNIEFEISQLNLPESVVRERLSAVKRAHKPLENFLSHIACLSKALILKKNVLILEDDFQFDRTPAQIMTYLEAVENYCEHRWDVICFSQKVSEWQFLTEAASHDSTTTCYSKICRIFQNTSTTGYLVNKLYIPRLVAYWIQKVRTILQNEKVNEVYNIEQVQTELQKSDIWIGFHNPIGHKGDEKWRYLDDLQQSIFESKIEHIKVHEPFEQKSIAICHLATKNYNKYVPAIQMDCYLKFLKLHRMEFFLFTDEASHYNKVTEEGAVIHIYPVESQDYTQDNLHRFHSLLSAEEALQKFDYIYYMDVDYRIYQHPVEDQLLVDGIAATAHLHSLVEKRDGSQRHSGMPENRPESTACIYPEEKITSCFTSSFHGGSSQSYLTMCNVLRRNIDQDTSRGIVAKWGDESHLNRYLLTYPPKSVLSQSYIFSERCLDLDCKEPMCSALRDAMRRPIMGPIVKT